MRPLIISTSRADWNSLGMVAKAFIMADVAPRIRATGSEPAYAAIKADGLAMDYIMDGDIAILLGDRVETLYEAIALSQKRIPIAHLSGGDVTEGSLDDGYRHAITKLSHLHFPTCARAALNLHSMGEYQSRIFNYGSPAVDRIKQTTLMDHAAICDLLDIFAESDFILVNWQSETLGSNEGHAAMLTVLAERSEYIVIVGANPEPGSVEINELNSRIASASDHIGFIHSFDPVAYLSMMKNCVCMIGNSSSAYYEAPILGTPAVDIGERQTGRLITSNVIPCQPIREEISEALDAATDMPHDEVEHPYGDGNAAERIVAEIMAVDDFPALLRKHHVVG